MKTYIINLERSPERRIYMEKVLKNHPLLDYEFITAVDGKFLSMEEREKLFDTKKFLERYSVEVRPGEIGCTLSHQRCYEKIVKDNEPFALILEDDIMPFPNNIELIKAIENKINVTTPQIILLSGSYWYYKTSPLTKNYKLANVYDAFFTHAYLINQAAAKLLIEKQPYITADDWLYIRKKGINLQALCPHLINQDWKSFETTINIGVNYRKSLKWYLKNFTRLTILKLLYFIGKYEKV